MTFKMEELTLWVKDETMVRRLCTDPYFLMGALMQDRTPAAKAFLNALQEGKTLMHRTNPCPNGGFSVVLCLESPTSASVAPQGKADVEQRAPFGESQWIHVRCPACRKPLKVQPQFAGKQVVCPHPACRAAVQIPASANGKDGSSVSRAALPNRPGSRRPLRRTAVPAWISIGPAVLAGASGLIFLLVSMRDPAPQVASTLPSQPKTEGLAPKPPRPAKPANSNGPNRSPIQRREPPPRPPAGAGLPVGYLPWGPLGNPPPPTGSPPFRPTTGSLPHAGHRSPEANNRNWPPAGEPPGTDAAPRAKPAQNPPPTVLEAESEKTPELPSPPSRESWPKKRSKTLESAIANYREDPVCAYLSFVGSLATPDSKEGTLSTEQRSWLKHATEILRPHVERLLERDYKRAIAADDARAAGIALEVRESVRGDGKEQDVAEMLVTLGKRYPEILKLLNETLQGRTRCPPVWKISGATATRLTSYSESAAVLNEIRITPKPGHEIVRVKAKVENISSTSDAVYAPKCLPGALSMLFDMDKGEWSKITGPRRLASQKFLSLKTNSGTLPCQFVCKGCGTLRGGTMSAFMIDLLGPGKGKVIPYPGSYVGRGQEFEIDVLFTVPKGDRDLRLYFLGSTPVPVAD
ncbi:MAG: hypothetical protein NTY19_02545 [Planctomycetota bacterium]|nr:hypothetical protein [Planctomycetota bacterium]